jgi:hypothetical protein
MYVCLVLVSTVYGAPLKGVFTATNDVCYPM